jgi:hypothetical protein
MAVRAKFHCSREKKVDWNATLRIYEFNAVCADEVPENQRYHKYTPSGTLLISVDNPEVKFEVGKSYYLDFTPA